MQLLEARPGAHRLNLAYGLISAEIVAPPRVFFVETPASTVVDLGCAYTMEVDEEGTGLLRVTDGWASLEWRWKGRESLVPAGASAATRPGVGPGIPSFDDASGRLREALLEFDFGPAGAAAAALETVLAEARDRDTLTLWHLLSRVDPGDRGRVFDRVAALTPVPAGVDRDRVLALDPDTLGLWASGTGLDVVRRGNSRFPTPNFQSAQEPARRSLAVGSLELEIGRLAVGS